MELPSSSSSAASPDLSQQDKPNNNDDAIKNWTKEEKYDLMDALKTFGRQDMEKIQKYVFTKSLEETKAAVDYFTAIALQHPIFKNTGDSVQSDPKHKPAKKPKVPLTEWTKLLTDNLKYDELRTETSTAVRMIADLENIPAKELTEDIDFRKVYHQIANAMDGKPLTPDVGTCAVLHKCVTETTLASKAFIKTAAKRNIVKNIDLSDNDELSVFPRPTEDHELAILRHLASQRNHNPLKIPEEHLKPSTPADEHLP